MKFNEIKIAGVCRKCGKSFDYGLPGEDGPSLAGLMAEDYTPAEAAEMYTICRECAKEGTWKTNIQ